MRTNSARTSILDMILRSLIQQYFQKKEESGIVVVLNIHPDLSHFCPLSIKIDELVFDKNRKLPVSSSRFREFSRVFEVIKGEHDV